MNTTKSNRLSGVEAEVLRRFYSMGDESREFILRLMEAQAKHDPAPQPTRMFKLVKGGES